MGSTRLELTTFVLGAPRSGTTLLRVMLAGHDQLFVPPEMVLAPFATMAQRKVHTEQRFWEKGGLCRALIELENYSVEEAKQVELELATKTVPEVYAYLQSLLGDRILVDKCPHLNASPEALNRLLEWFSETRFVWIVRHPGSVTRSLENMPYAELMLQRYAKDARDVWFKCNLVIGQFLAQIPKSHWCQIRYEDMVREPQPAMETICSTIGIPFQAEMLNPYDGDKMREGPTRKMFADCPDADYRKAALRLDQGDTYRISGCVPTGTNYCGIVLYRKGGLVGNSINDLDLQLDDQGRFELHIGLKSSKPEESDSAVTGPWLLGDGDETGVIVRQYFTDRQKQSPVELHIERQQATSIG